MLVVAACKGEPPTPSAEPSAPEVAASAEEEISEDCAGAEKYRFDTPGGPRVAACKDPEGRLHGPYRVTMPDGVVTAEGRFSHGAESGRWLYRHPTGKRWREGEYLDGLRHGEWKVWSPEGKPLGSYRMERGTGVELRWWPAGGKRQSSSYREGVLEGVTTWWFESGAKLMEANFQSGLPHGAWTYWDEVGNIRRIQDWNRGDLRETAWAQPLPDGGYFLDLDAGPADAAVGPGE